MSCISCLGMLFANHAAHVFRAQAVKARSDLTWVLNLGMRHGLHISSRSKHAHVLVLGVDLRSRKVQTNGFAILWKD
jgi:hypothetical protein